MLRTITKLRYQKHTKRNHNYTKTENSLFSLITITKYLLVRGFRVLVIETITKNFVKPGNFNKTKPKEFSKFKN